MTEQTNVQEQTPETQGTEQKDKFVWVPGQIEIATPEAQETQEQEFKLDGRTKRALDIAISKKQVSQESHAAVLAGRIDLAKAKELGREGSPDTPVGPAPKKVSKKDRSRSCMCLCGRSTKGGRFAAGHDQRLVTYAKEYVRRARVDGRATCLLAGEREARKGQGAGRQGGCEVGGAGES